MSADDKESLSRENQVGAAADDWSAPIVATNSWQSPGREILIHSAEHLGELDQGGARAYGQDPSLVLHQKVVDSAELCGLDDASCALIREANGVTLDPSKYAKYIAVLQGFLHRQELRLGKNDPSLAYTEMLIGVCQQRARDLHVSVKSFRSSVVRFQQSDNPDCALFIDCLCRTSEIYRLQRKLDAARTCIKQAYRILPYCDGQVHTHCRVLEELAALLMAEQRHRAAATALKRLIQIRMKVLQFAVTDVVHPLINLAMCYFTMHMHQDAYAALVRACDIYYETGCEDQFLLVEILEKMAGVLRHQGFFLQSDLLTERAQALLGRFDQMCGHPVYGNLVDAAIIAERAGDLNSAKQKYRDALTALEGQRERRIADRVPILARIYLMTATNQVIQRTSLLSDIEDAIREFFNGGQDEMPVVEGLRRLSILYKLLGKPAASRDLIQLADELSPGVLEITMTSNNRLISSG